MTRRLVLVGAGHAHVEVLRRLALRPLPDVAVTLVTRTPATAYSGMLPGVLAGHYAPDALTIPVAPLAERAGAALRIDSAVALDPVGCRLRLASGTELAFDLASLDVGSVAALAGAAGDERVLLAKPIDRFVTRWEAAEPRLRPGDRVAVVGAGAAGVELALALAWRFEQAERRVAVDLVERGPQILQGQPARARRLATAACAERGVRVLTETATPPEAAALVIWSAGAAAPEWIAGSGVATDEGGFVAVGPELRSLSHPQVFAAGDVATMVADPRPKAGVFAVRQGPVLADNLARALDGRPLRRYRPQRAWLSLIATGPRHAIATRNGITLAGRWVWWWKDRNDRAWVARYVE